MYIAAAVGGVALVLIFLYVKTPVAVSQPGSLPDASQTIGAADQNPYNYNIQPYGGDGPLNIPARGPISNQSNVGGRNSGGGCCDNCGTSQGSSYQNPGVLAFLKLLALGA